MRVDKWLWAARFFKTRGLAQAAVTGGKVKVNGERVKPAKDLAPGDRIAIRIGELEWRIVVEALSDRRGPAETARQLYVEDEASRALRIAQVADRRAQASVWGERKGRPTKRERREMERWRNEEYGERRKAKGERRKAKGEATCSTTFLAPFAFRLSPSDFRLPTFYLRLNPCFLMNSPKFSRSGTAHCRALSSDHP